MLRPRRFLGTLHDEARVGDHLQVGGARGPLGGEVIAQEDGVGNVQA